MAIITIFFLSSTTHEFSQNWHSPFDQGLAQMDQQFSLTFFGIRLGENQSQDYVNIYQSFLIDISIHFVHR